MSFVGCESRGTYWYSSSGVASAGRALLYSRRSGVVRTGTPSAWPMASAVWAARRRSLDQMRTGSPARSALRRSAAAAACRRPRSLRAESNQWQSQLLGTWLSAGWAWRTTMIGLLGKT